MHSILKVGFFPLNAISYCKEEIVDVLQKQATIAWSFPLCFITFLADILPFRELGPILLEETFHLSSFPFSVLNLQLQLAFIPRVSRFHPS